MDPHAPRGSKIRQGAGSAATVQLLGSVDDIVAPEDNVNSIAGSDFYYLDVPRSSHRSIVEMDRTADGQCRRKKLTKALICEQTHLKEISLFPEDDPPQPSDPQKRHVIFVMHGIRDQGYWTSKIGRKVLERARVQGKLKEVAIETSPYGFFPMLPFLLASKRREKVEWFMERYAEAAARYPNATFHFFGHSNGTYCLAKALALYRCCHFGRVAFAGSVVPQSFDWEKAANLGQVDQVLNLTATADWVVAGFPRLFEWLRLSDLGSAGHNGFCNKEKDTQWVANRGYARGGHGAATVEGMWDYIAQFLYPDQSTPARPEPLAPLVAEKHRSWAVCVFRHSSNHGMGNRLRSRTWRGLRHWVARLLVDHSYFAFSAQSLALCANASGRCPPLP